MNPLKHVAIIMDGNGRWGLKNKNSRNAGHKAGLITVEKAYKVRNFILFLIVSFMIFSTVFKPALCPAFLEFLFLKPHLPLPSMIMAT